MRRRYESLPRDRQALSVYDGQVCAGHIQQTDDHRWRAINIAGDIVGTFPNQLAAIRALSDVGGRS